MIVKMLKDTNYSGFKKAGETYNIDDTTAKRWQRMGICNSLLDEPTKKEKITVHEEVTATKVPLNELPIKQLVSMCREQGIKISKSEVEDLTPEEKKDFLLSLLAGD